VKPRARANPRQRMHLCRYCGSDFVVPVKWAPFSNEDFWIRLRCGECEGIAEAIVDDATAQRYDLDLAVGMGELALTLKLLEREHMAEEADALAVALRLDLIDAGDFLR
jgi:hypothetical protein